MDFSTIITNVVTVAIFGIWAKWLSGRVDKSVKQVTELITTFKLELEKDFVRIGKFEQQSNYVNEKFDDAKQGRENIWTTMNERTEKQTKLINDMKLDLITKVTEIITILKIKGMHIEDKTKNSF